MSEERTEYKTETAQPGIVSPVTELDPEKTYITNPTVNRYDVEHSTEIGVIAAALSKAQGEIRNALKDRDNPFCESRYATLASVRSACQEPLAKNSLAIVQLPGGTGENISLTTILTHESGQWFKSIITAPPVFNKKANPVQHMGSTITYLRRYALSAMVGVAVDDDDGSGELTAVPEDTKVTIRAMIIDEYGVDEGDLVAYLGCPLERITTNELPKCQYIYKRLKAGEAWDKIRGPKKVTERQKAVEDAKKYGIEIVASMKTSDIRKAINRASSKPKQQELAVPAEPGAATPDEVRGGKKLEDLRC